MTNEDITNKIYELCEKYDTSIDKIEINTVEKELKELLKPYKQGSIGIAQINPIAGNIEYNAKKIIKYIIHAQNIGLDAVVFPEYILMGFSLGDTINRYSIITEDNIKWLNEIAKITTTTTALVGFIDNENNSSVGVLSDGKIQKIIKKSQLSENTLNINGVKYFITIGEDCQSINISENPDIIINCCAEIAKVKGEQIKNDILSDIANKYSTSLVYINQVGATDNYSFIGASKVFDKEGKIISQAKSFEEQFLIINPLKNLGKIYQSFNQSEKLQSETKTFTLDYESDLERTYKIIIQGIRDYFYKTGFKKAVLGLSGGLDSSVCAVLLTDALGKENVLGISMPSKITSNESKTDAQILAQNLGINFAIMPIKDMVETTDNSLQNLFKNVEQKWNNRYKESFTMDNIQARSRAICLWGISNEFSQTLPIATSDKSEAYMGYATINGDMSGGFAPIADVTKTKLFALARWLNKNREIKDVIPQSIINKSPGAELAINPKTGKPLIAEDALMPYEFLDEIIWRIENNKEQYKDMINSQFLYEKSHILTQEQKIEWLDKFYRRMSSALYKRTIMPPYVIVDSDDDYKQPITSCQINYKGLNSEEIKNKIDEIISTLN